MKQKKLIQKKLANGTYLLVNTTDKQQMAARKFVVEK